MIQGIEQIPQNVNPANIGIGIFLAFLMVDKISFWVLKFKEKNGKGKDDTKAFQTMPCTSDPRFQTHATETHDTLQGTIRNEARLGRLGAEIQKQTIEQKVQTTEMVKQTGILEAIRKNGNGRK